MADLGAVLALLNDGATLGEVKADLKELNDYANAHPELSLAGNVRSNLHAAASLLALLSPASDATPAPDAAPADIASADAAPAAPVDAAPVDASAEVASN